MSDDAEIEVPKFLTRAPDYIPNPKRVPVTAAFMAECRAKQDAYARGRRRYTDGYGEPEGDLAQTWTEIFSPVSVSATPPSTRSPPRGHINDRKQRTLALV